MDRTRTVPLVPAALLLAGLLALAEPAAAQSSGHRLRITVQGVSAASAQPVRLLVPLRRGLAGRPLTAEARAALTYRIAAWGAAKKITGELRDSAPGPTVVAALAAPQAAASSGPQRLEAGTARALVSGIEQSDADGLQAELTLQAPLEASAARPLTGPATTRTIVYTITAE
ncbi:MAG: hypothetical protein R3362_05960 [Rhodothermales bacterium]|nr:hypothetical protein [Rhodothermales bacterium]